MAMTKEQKDKLLNGTLWAVKGLADEMRVNPDECISVISAAMLALALKEPNHVAIAGWLNRHLASYNIPWRLTVPAKAVTGTLQRDDMHMLLDGIKAQIEWRLKTDPADAQQVYLALELCERVLKELGEDDPEVSTLLAMMRGKQH